MAQQKASKKHGRNKKRGQNARYINEQRHDKSHARRIKKHLMVFPDDWQAVAALKDFEIKLGVHSTRPK